MMHVLPAAQPAPSPSGESSTPKTSAGSNEDDTSFLAVLGEALSAMSDEVVEDQSAGSAGDASETDAEGDGEAAAEGSVEPVLPADALAALIVQLESDAEHGTDPQVTAELEAAVEAAMSGELGDEVTAELVAATQESEDAANPEAATTAEPAAGAEPSTSEGSAQPVNTDAVTPAAQSAAPSPDVRTNVPTTSNQAAAPEAQVSASGEPVVEPTPVQAEVPPTGGSTPDTDTETAQPVTTRPVTTSPTVSSSGGGAEPVAPTPPTAAPATSGAATNMFDVDPTTLEGDDPWQQLATVVRPLRNMADGSQRLSLQLRPAELGTVHLEVSVEDGQISVRAVTETAATRDLLATAMPELRAELSRSGVDVGSLDVGENTTDGSGPDGENRAQPQRLGTSEASDTPTPSNDSPTTASHSGRLDLSL